ncbi:MAG: extracellular solute-binding protein, partial [Mariprofundaceae bacterium]|nr:extracellular solute-binding protein [Mariprofundaceae bacterium]
LEAIDDDLRPTDLADIPDFVWQRVNVGDHKYGWPWFMSTTALAVNLDLFREAGALHLLPRNAEKSWTVDQFLVAARAVTRDTSGDGQPDVYALPLFGVDNHFLYDAFLAGHGILSKFNDAETQCTLLRPEAITVLQFLADLLRKYRVAYPGAAGLKYTDAYTLFLQQKVAMFPGGMWMLSAIGAQAPEPFDYTFVQFPHWPGYRSYATAMLAAYVIFKQDDPRARDAAMRFARYLTSTRNAIAVTGNSTFPVRRSCGNPYYGDARFDVFRHYMRFSIPEPHKPHSQKIEDLSMPLYQAVFSGVPPKQALAEYVRQVNTVLAAERLD